MVDHLIRGLSITLFWRRVLHPFIYHLIDIPRSLDMRLKSPFKNSYIWDSLDQDSPYASSLVLVKKKDGTLRMCIDFRDLNKKTTKNIYSLPWIYELMDEIFRAN